MTKKIVVKVLEELEKARLQAVEERNKTLTIINNFVDGLMVLNKEGRILLVNSQFKKIFKINKKLEGKKIEELKSFRFFQPWISLILRGKKIKTVSKKEFSTHPEQTLEVTSVPLIERGRENGYLISFHDISREKSIEKLKTEFISLTAHQLRTPLSAIKWTLEMMLAGDLGKLTKEQQEFIEKIHQSNEKMILLINDLLRVVKIEGGKYLFKLVPADIENLIQEVINSYKKTNKQKKIRIEFRKPKKKLPQVKIDIEKMEIAIKNLLDNAVNYGGKGNRVIISLKKRAKTIEFQIKDKGIGIPKEQQNRVFTKFFRGSNVVKMETNGTGLGLFIVKNIIKAHGGKIWFKSKENKGSTFYFTLPIPAK